MGANKVLPPAFRGTDSVYSLGDLGSLHYCPGLPCRCSQTFRGEQPCRKAATYFWVRAGKADVDYCYLHALSTFPEAFEPLTAT